MYQARDKVFWFAICSHTFIFFVQIIFNALCPDHNADAFRMPTDPNENYSFLDNIVSFLFGGLTRWDAQYYIHIAKYGYTYENTLAFFPLFPMMIRYIAMVLRIEPILNYSNTIVISGFLINFVCFVKATLILYDLTEAIFKDNKIAYRAAVLFCINPARIFFTAIYTESMFAYLTFYSMLESFNNNPCVFLPLGLSSLVRSNGLVNIGFPIYIWIKNFLSTTIPNFMSEYKYYHSNKRSLLFDLRHIIISMSQIISVTLFSLLPFCLLQVYNYSKFCQIKTNTTTILDHVQEYGIKHDLLMPERDEFSWCKTKIPIAYSYVQSKYWNVGFLNYYHLKQIPNFVLALPILYIFIRCCCDYFMEHKLKFCTTKLLTTISNQNKSENKKFPIEVFVFIAHGLFLTLFCIFFVHIQVSTRLLCSASPLLYWYCALTTLSSDKSRKVKLLEYEIPDNVISKWKVFFLTQHHYTFEEKLMFGYFFSYIIMGCFMYSNFLPWT